MKSRRSSEKDVLSFKEKGPLKTEKDTASFKSSTLFPSEDERDKASFASSSLFSSPASPKLKKRHFNPFHPQPRQAQAQRAYPEPRGEAPERREVKVLDLTRLQVLRRLYNPDVPGVQASVPRGAAGGLERHVRDAVRARVRERAASGRRAGS
jgi:hypothetical protein